MENSDKQYRLDVFVESSNRKKVIGFLKKAFDYGRSDPCHYLFQEYTSKLVKALNDYKPDLALGLQPYLKKWRVDTERDDILIELKEIAKGLSGVCRYFKCVSLVKKDDGSFFCKAKRKGLNPESIDKCENLKSAYSKGK